MKPKKIIGNTVGTPTSPKKMGEILRPVTSINGQTPDKNGNVAIDVSSGQNANGGLSATAAALLITILRGCRYLTEQGDNIAALEAALASSGGSETPDTPDTGVSIRQSGSALILSGVPAITSITQSGNVLTLA